MMMYQLPIDMMARIASVTRATMSLPFSRASRPYGLSTSSGVRGPAFAACAAVAGGGGLSRRGGWRRWRLGGVRDDRGGRGNEQDRGQRGHTGRLQHGVSRQI